MLYIQVRYAQDFIVLCCGYNMSSKKTSKLCITGLCEGNSPVTAEFPSQRPVTQKMFPSDDIIMHFAKYAWHVDGILPKHPTRHAYTWQIGPFWQDTLDVRYILSTLQLEFIIGCLGPRHELETVKTLSTKYDSSKYFMELKKLFQELELNVKLRKWYIESKHKKLVNKN